MSIDFSAAIRSVQAMLNGLLAQLPYIVIGLLVFALFWWLSGLASRLIERLIRRRSSSANLAVVIARLSRSLLVFVGLLVALVVVFPSFTLGRLIELLGIGGVAIGFAFRDILQNFLAGILLLLTNPFKIGDQIVVDAYEGTVEDIQTRATLIRTYDNRRVVIPNSDLFTKSVTVNTAFDKRRIEYEVGIGYSDDVEHARAVILRTLAGLDAICQEPAPEVLMVALADSSVNLLVRWWIAPPARRELVQTRHTVLVAIKKALDANGIEIPFPIRTVYFHDETPAADSRRN